MPEEIKHYVAPIAVIPPRALLQGELYKQQQRLKRVSKPESIASCEMQIKRILHEIEKLS